MQPFCEITTGSLGTSNVRSPKPSAIKTITFCRPPLESAIISRVRTGPACCLEQLGSADMLIGLGGGTVPVYLTVPRISPVPEFVGAEPDPAITICRLEMQIVNITIKEGKKCLSFIGDLGEGFASQACVCYWESCAKITQLGARGLPKESC